MAMSRTQRCGHCEGCLAKACGTCVYCKDNPQFGGPGVKKQSCVARRCTRVLEGKLQREATGLRAKTGCGYCEECRQSDCGVCLVCMDKRFFRGKFLPNALCAKKKCSNARSLDASPRHSPSPKQTSFKMKQDNLHANTSFGSNTSSNGGSLIRKRLMVGDSGGGPLANGSKKSKKPSDVGVPLAQHPSTYNNPFSAHSTFSRNGSEPGVNGLDRVFMTQHPRPSYPHLAAPAAHPPTAQMQQTGYNGSPPAGTVAPATSAHSEFGPYVQTATNGAASQAPPSYQLAAVSLPSSATSSSSQQQEMYNLYCSFPPVAGNRLTAGQSSSQPLQPPPYQWPSTKVLFPTTTTLDHMMTSTQQHHHVVNSSATANVANHLNHHNHHVPHQQQHHSTAYGEHPMLRDRLSSSVSAVNCSSSLVAVHNNNQSSDDQQDSVQLQHKLMQFYRSDKSHPYYNHHANTVNQTLPGSIVTEPMGPMGQPKVILQQL